MPAATRLTLLYVAGASVAILGLAVRLESITASLWLDEFGTLWVVEGDLATMLRRCWDFQGQSPLYYVLPWISIHAFGESEVALRVPSLVAGSMGVWVVYMCARSLGGTSAGYWAAALYWLSVPNVRHSVEARPYVLVLFTVAVAIAGFVWTLRSGDRRARAVWIVGGAAAAWVHYVHYPLVVGLMAAYVVSPPLRLRYPLRHFLADGALQLALIAPCLPQILNLVARRGTLAWIDQWNYGAFLEPLLALALPILIGVSQPRRRREPPHIEPALERSLLIAILFQIVILETAALIGVNLLTGRYFVSTLVPAVLLASITLPRLRKSEAVAALVTFALVTGLSLGATKRLTGTFTGLGYENWRGAVADLSSRVQKQPGSIVFFRSGFVEEDVLPLGTPPPTTLAPLRSPGLPALNARVTPLNFRWAHPLREAYFDRVIRPEVSTMSRFFLVGIAADAGGGSYADRFVEWVETSWPGQFDVLRTDYGGVELLDVQRR